MIKAWAEDLRDAWLGFWEHLKYGAMFIVLISFFGGPIHGLFTEAEPRAYRVAGPVIYERRGGDVLAVVNFTKNDACTYQQLWAFGSRNGQVFPVDFSFPLGEQGDRPAGLNTLRVALLDVDEFARVRVVTRHLCDGEKADAEMFVFTPSQIKAAEEELK